MTDLTVYTTESRADIARQVLGPACRAAGATARLEQYGTGSLYQRLGPRHAPPIPDVVLWFGPWAAASAAIDGLLQRHQPPQVADSAAHASDWAWTAVDYSPIRVSGASPVASLADLSAVPRLAVADPERSEAGLAILLAVIDRSRQADGDAERGWNWWVERARAGLVLAEDDAGAVALVQDGTATHALTLESDGAPLTGLPPIPHAVGVAASSRNVDGARRLVDWLTSSAAGALLPSSPWQASTNGLAALQQTAPALDVDWTRQQYTITRRRWAQNGFTPNLASP